MKVLLKSLPGVGLEAAASGRSTGLLVGGAVLAMARTARVHDSHTPVG